MGTGEVVVPKRPESVPLDAVWGGGIDGGYWLDCQELTEIQDAFYCMLYNDYSGDLEFQWQFYTERLDRSLTCEQILNLFDYYNNGIIHLEDGSKLRTSKPFDEITYEEIQEELNRSSN
jgi:hypothetical protein